MDEQNPGFIVKRRGAIGSARADFMCNSATCRTKKGARVYELPAASVKCPVCSKKLTKLMSAPHISTGKAKRVDAITAPEYERQQAKRDRAKEQKRVAPPIAVDASQGLASAVQQGMARAGYGHIPVPVPLAERGVARPTLGVTSPDLAGIKAAGGVTVPRHVVGKWVPESKDIEAARRTT